MRLTFTGVPELAPLRAPRVLDTAQRRLRNGLSVLAVRRTGVPLAEIRLRVPFGSTAPSHAARAALLAECVLAGTERRDRVGFAEALQRNGASLSASGGADRLGFGGGGRTTRRPARHQHHARART